MGSEQECWQALFTGNLRRAAEGFDALRQTEASTSATAGLFLALVFSGSDEAAQRILTDRDRDHGDLGMVLWQASWIGASNNIAKALDLLNAFFDRIGATPSWRAPLSYGRGHIAAIAGDKMGAISNFIEAGQTFALDPMLYLKNDDASLRSVVFQSMHMLPEETVGTLAKNQDRNHVAITWLDRPLPADGNLSTPVIVAAADPHYLQLYGSAFTCSVLEHHPDSHIHLHVADGDACDFDTLVRSLPGSLKGSVSGSLSDTKRWPVHKPPVYASTRFLIAADLLNRFQAPLLLLDIDATLKQPLDPLFSVAESNDLSCWVRPDGGPGGYTAAGAVAVSPSAGRSVAHLTAAYIDRRLSEESHHLWFVDQAALFRAAHHIATKQEESFRWGDFSSVGSFEDFFDHAPESPDKRR